MFDASTVVGAALRRDGVPRRALAAARERGTLALSAAVFAEVSAVLARPKFRSALTPGARDEVLELLTASAAWAEPTGRVADCRDPGDDMYLELALAAGADALVSSDGDLLALHPWRGVPVLRPAEFLAACEAGRWAGEG